MSCVCSCDMLQRGWLNARQPHNVTAPAPVPQRSVRDSDRDSVEPSGAVQGLELRRQSTDAHYRRPSHKHCASLQSAPWDTGPCPRQLKVWHVHVYFQGAGALPALCGTAKAESTYLQMESCRSSALRRRRGWWRAHGGLSVEWLMLPCKNMPVNR